MKTIIFGGTGWVGHHIALDFIRAGFDVTICSRGRKDTYIDRIGGVKRISADKQNNADMKEILSAGFEIVIDSVPTVKSIELISKYAVKLRHYLHCSSTGGYTPLPFVPCNETAPYHGAAGAGWGEKAVCDAEVMRLFNTIGFPATVIRPCYSTGGADRLPLDNLGGRREDFIPDILAGHPLEVPNDGLALLQPIHVEDLAHSFLLAVQNRRSIGERYNICLDHALTLNDYLRLNAEAIGCRAVLEHVDLELLVAKYPERETGLRFVAEHMCFDIIKARTELEYKPAHTPEETVAETAFLTAERHRADTTKQGRIFYDSSI